ncbi:hypothetical protein GIS00_03605 [Nakamurella sp. YIM 132087]|uniref:Uncharacterized protein n=1 Tax=Nakamurella alba TaxID=2665158 RepID=A0A7K1FFZ2_9ACTN|nr:hypothetical protein [Nakamurella alba]MTD13031.1 hypothetical protein [Nakamurella alba]
MAVLPLDPEQLLRSVRDALAGPVLDALPGRGADFARAELLSAVELLDNIAGGLTWSPDEKAAEEADLADLETTLGLPPTEGDRAGRLRTVGDRIRGTYTADQDPQDTIAAVLAWTDAELRRGMSTATRASTIGG